MSTVAFLRFYFWLHLQPNYGITHLAMRKSEPEPLVKWISILYRYSMMYAHKRLKEFDISGGQMPFFIVIVDSAGIKQEELSAHLKVNKGTTAKAVKALEKKGYIIRKKDATDARSYRLYPSKKAVELRKKIREIAFEWERILLEGIEDKAEMLSRMLEKMSENADSFMESLNEKAKR